MNFGVRSTTRVLALLGDPVAHSLSPVFQNAAIRSAGLDGVYVALRCSANEVAGLVRGLSMAGGGGNVTIPHKGSVADLLDEPDDAVRRTGACNTFWTEDDRICGTNTDVEGVREAVRALLGGAPQGARVVLLGAGGAARAAAVALLDDGAAQIEVANRSPARAEALVASLDDRRLVAVPLASRTWVGADLLIHATSLGLRPSDPAAAEFTPVDRPAAVLDLVYSPEGETPLVVAAQELGIPAADGREMLLHQGAASFQRWWGIPAPFAEMRAAIDDRVSRVDEVDRVDGVDGVHPDGGVDRDGTVGQRG